MAVNEKALYANTHLLTGDPRRPLNPGQQIDTARFGPEAIRSLQERGLVTTSHTEAQQLETAERARRENVAQQIATRSEKRDHKPQEDRRH